MLVLLNNSSKAPYVVDVLEPLLDFALQPLVSRVLSPQIVLKSSTVQLGDGIERTALVYAHRTVDPRLAKERCVMLQHIGRVAIKTIRGPSGIAPSGIATTAPCRDETPDRHGLVNTFVWSLLMLKEEIDANLDTNPLVLSHPGTLAFVLNQLGAPDDVIQSMSKRSLLFDVVPVQ